MIFLLFWIPKLKDCSLINCISFPLMIFYISLVMINCIIRAIFYFLLLIFLFHFIVALFKKLWQLIIYFTLLKYFNYFIILLTYFLIALTKFSLIIIIY